MVQHFYLRLIIFDGTKCKIEMEAQKLLWRPPSEFIERSNLKRFEDWLAAEKDLTFEGYQDLWEWSVDNIETFWEAIWKFFDITSYGSHENVLSGDEMPTVQWFKGTSLNYAEHIFKQNSEDRPALYFKMKLKSLG